MVLWGTAAGSRGILFLGGGGAEVLWRFVFCDLGLGLLGHRYVEKGGGIDQDA